MKEYVICECFEKMNEKLTKHYEQKGIEIIEPFEPYGKMWLCDQSANGTGLSIQFESKAKCGKKSSKAVKANITASNCPFCGKSMVKETED